MAGIGDYLARTGYNKTFLTNTTPLSGAAVATPATSSMPDLTNRLMEIMGGNLSGTLTGGEKLSALGALLKSVSRGSQTSPQDVLKNIQQQKLQQVQGALQIQELRKQALEQAKAEAGLQTFASRLSAADRSVFDGLPLAEKIKWATRGESTGFDPVTGQQVYTSGPRIGEVIPRAIASEGGAPVNAAGLGKPGTLVMQGNVPGRINEKGVWEALPQRTNYVTEYRMINGKKTLVQVDTATGKIEPVTAGQPTEGEMTAGYLTSRLNDSLSSLKKLYKANPDQVVPTVGQTVVKSLFGEDVANVTKTPERQQIEAAQRDAVSAALTLSTGAAYTPLELDTLTRSYFPQIGDDKATIAFKQQKWENLLQSAKIKSGRAAPMPQGSAPKPSGPKTFTIGGKQFTISPKG